METNRPDFIGIFPLKTGLVLFLFVIIYFRTSKIASQFGTGNPSTYREIA